MNEALAAKIAAAKKTGPDMNESQAGGGGDYTPPAPGLAMLRLVGYFEIGKQKKEYNGKVTYPEKVKLVFEVHGKKWPVTELPDGTKLPVRMTVTEQLSLGEKAHFYKLFKMMNYDGSATHMAEMLGKAFLGQIINYESKTPDGRTVVRASLRSKEAGYQIRGPFYEDPETGEKREANVPLPITPIKAFFWDLADKADWDALYIPGWYEEPDPAKGKPGRSKNVLQEEIMQAQNWKEHPLYAILAAGGATPDIPDAEQPEHNEERAVKQDANDPLAGIA